RKADRRQSAELAGPPGAGPSRRRPGALPGRAGAALRRAGRPSALAGAASGDLGNALGAAPAAGAGVPLRRPDPPRPFIPRSARLPALPLPLDGAALAMPALPRMEYVRRRANRAREGESGLLTLAAPRVLVLGIGAGQNFAVSANVMRAVARCGASSR